MVGGFAVWLLLQGQAILRREAQLKACFVLSFSSLTGFLLTLCVAFIWCERGSARKRVSEWEILVVEWVKESLSSLCQNRFYSNESYRFCTNTALDDHGFPFHVFLIFMNLSLLCFLCSWLFFYQSFFGCFAWKKTSCSLFSLSCWCHDSLPSLWVGCGYSLASWSLFIAITENGSWSVARAFPSIQIQSLSLRHWCLATRMSSDKQLVSACLLLRPLTSSLFFSSFSCGYSLAWRSLCMAARESINWPLIAENSERRGPPADSWQIASCMWRWPKTLHGCGGRRSGAGAY